MSDDLDDLKSAFGAATPAPDAARRAENLALAQKNFEALQGSREAARPTPVTAPSGLWTGLKAMLTSLTSRGALGATTALVACGFLVLTDTGQGLWLDQGEGLSGFSGTENPAQPPQATLADEKVVADATPEPMVITTEVAPSEAPAGPADLSLGDAVAGDESPELSVSESPALALAFEDQDDLASGVAREREIARAEQPVVKPDGIALDMEPSDQESLSFRAAPAAPRRSAPAPRGDLGRTQSSPDPNRLLPGQTAPVTASNDAYLEEAAPSAIAPAPVIEAPSITQTTNTEAFANEAPASLKITQETPVSTFSIDVDTASYALLRSSITRGQLPRPEQVRIEELVNYFPYDYPAPDAGEAPFRPTVSTMQTPWNADTQLVHIAIQGQLPAIDDRPPLNLVFLIDTSGSMNQPNKLPLLKQSLGLMLGQLRPEDQVAIVAYAGSAGQVLAPTSAAKQITILTALNGLGAGGSTNGQGGLQQAYAVAETMQAEGEVSRILLATDGDFNVGINNPDALKDFIADKRDTGTYLSVLGFGRGNLDDATMQALAQNGNGQAAYIDTLTEAQKVLVDQLTGELFPIAGDVKIQVEWNPVEVAEYRLIGYETRALAREDFNNDKVDAGELGAGHSVTAIYEVTPVGSPAQLSDPLRYAPAQAAESNGELGFLKLRYKEPGASESQLLTTPIVPTQGASSEAQFAAAIAGFGQLLRDDRFLGEWGYPEAIALANANRGDDPFGYRAEAVQLMRLAFSVSGSRLGR